MRISQLRCSAPIAAAACSGAASRGHPRQPLRSLLLRPLLLPRRLHTRPRAAQLVLDCWRRLHPCAGAFLVLSNHLCRQVLHERRVLLRLHAAAQQGQTMSETDNLRMQAWQRLEPVTHFDAAQSW